MLATNCAATVIRVLSHPLPVVKQGRAFFMCIVVGKTRVGRSGLEAFPGTALAFVDGRVKPGHNG
jgi:hypothetical protein